MKKRDLAMFQNDWMEVELNVKQEQRVVEDSSSNPRPRPADEKKSPLYKEIYLDVDVGKKSDRQEWGHVKYQSTYRPEEAFEIVSQWIQATGSIITELVRQRHRCGKLGFCKKLY